MAEFNHTLSSSEVANIRRWSAADGAWRGYRRRGGQLEYEDRVLRAVELAQPSGGLLLDIGCADGAIGSLLGHAARARAVIGVDLAPVRSQIPKCVCNLDSSNYLPFRDGAFDVVACLETLEHVHDTDHLVREIHRVLAPKAYAILSVPRLDGLLNIGLLAAGLQPPGVDCSLERRYGTGEANRRVSGHVAHFTRRAFEEILASHGLAVEAYRQASIYSGWLFATPPGQASRWKRLGLWALSKLPYKQDDQIVRVRKRA
jgi:SAM-dependent methyltransferase